MKSHKTRNWTIANLAHDAEALPRTVEQPNPSPELGESDAAVEPTVVESGAVHVEGPAFGPGQHLEDSPDKGPIEDEQSLSHNISKLWSEQRDQETLAKRTSAELKAIRAQLAAQLYTYKQHLGRTGRSGAWASFLRSQKIPLSTADRYVERHRLTNQPRETKLLTEDISEATPVEVSALVSKMLPKLVRLTTPAAVRQFVEEVREGLQAQLAAASTSALACQAGADRQAETVPVTDSVPAA